MLSTHNNSFPFTAPKFKHINNEKHTKISRKRRVDKNKKSAVYKA
jgi:hypothetical protein